MAGACCALMVALPCRGWDTQPHQKITRAALETLPKAILSRLGAEAGALAELYCIYPDRYQEMERFGFVRRGPGPRDASEIRRYCVRQDGEAIHGVTGDRETDTRSLVYLLEHMAADWAANRAAEAARYAGVLSHFIGDSLSPPHSAEPGELESRIHSAIERGLPDLTLGGRVPHSGGSRTVDIAKTLLDRCYAGAEQNRKDLAAIVKAAEERDERALDGYRLRAGTRAAEILADALFSVFRR